jgi:hypothetical protein
LRISYGLLRMNAKRGTVVLRRANLGKAAALPYQDGNVKRVILE